MSDIFRIGDEAWILEAQRYPRPVRIRGIRGEMCLLQFTDRGYNVSGTMIRMSRLFATREEALANALPKPEDRSRGYADVHAVGGKHYWED